MQTGQVNFGTDYYIEQPYFREDENNDSVFYKTERLQSHLDEVARNEIEKLYLYLSSDDASFITGANIMIDGGFTAQ